MKTEMNNTGFKTAEEIFNNETKTYISARDAINGYKGDEYTEQDCKDTVIEAMEEYAYQFKPKWIDVKDRLPEELKKVLCLGEVAGASPNMGGSYVFISYITTENGKSINSRYIDDNGFVAAYVTHWMELPSKPLPSCPA